MSGLHTGRSWTGHEIEDACPCPQEACGLVVPGNPDCPEHSDRACKSLRQGHPAELCPASREGGTLVTAEHPFGVRIPPDKGDANYEAYVRLMAAARFMRPDAPETPHAPATAPNATPRGSADAADGSEALRGALWAKLDAALDDARDTSIYRWPQQQDVDPILDALLPLVLAYGREQATQAGERALAPVEQVLREWHLHLEQGTQAAWPLRAVKEAVGKARADELGRQA